MAKESRVKNLIVERVKKDLVATFGRKCAKAITAEARRKLPKLDDRIDLYMSLIKYEQGQGGDLKKLTGQFKVVSPHVFFTDPYFTNDHDSIWPAVRDELCEMNSGKYDEIVHTGAIGAAKTTTAVLCQQYQLYILSCYDNPHAIFGLNPNHEIEIIFQSLKESHAKEVGYERFRQAIMGSPYFQEHFPPDPNVKSKLVFPNRVEVKYVSGSQTATLGHNVIGGVLDEVNFMQVIEDSKQAADGDVYDQAIALYNSIVRRRKSRFLKVGEKLPGILSIVSSKRYPGQFTDTKIEEAKTKGDKSRIYVYDKKVWDINPDKYKEAEWFHVYVGTETKKPRILHEGEKVSDAEKELVMAIPMDYHDEFVRDPYSSLRDIAGVSTKAKNPFIPNNELVAQCFGKRGNILNVESTDFTDTIKVHKKQVKDTHLPRLIHIDYGLTGDSAGVACGYVSGFKKVKHLDAIETLPEIQFDFILRVDPPEGGEIIFSKVRNLLYKIRDKIGVPMRWATMDSWQSVDTVQILRAKGFMTGVQSIDKTPLPYDITKTALYDGRVHAPEHYTAFDELTSLEIAIKGDKVKIDHPPNGSKDCADAVAGVVFGLTMRLEIWSMFDIPPHEIPASVLAASQAHSSAENTESIKSVA